MANLNFKKDLDEIGEVGEKIICKHLESIGYEFITFGKDNRFDIIMFKGSTPVAIEVKTDVLITEQFDTGNIFIEFESRGKASGITTTKSSIFITYLPHLKKALVAKTSDIIKLIEGSELRMVDNCGDKGSNTKGFLINREKYKELFTILKIEHDWKT